MRPTKTLSRRHLRRPYFFLAHKRGFVSAETEEGRVLPLFKSEADAAEWEAGVRLSGLRVAPVPNLGALAALLVDARRIGVTFTALNPPPGENMPLKMETLFSFYRREKRDAPPIPKALPPPATAPYRPPDAPSGESEGLWFLFGIEDSRATMTLKMPRGRCLAAFRTEEAARVFIEGSGLEGYEPGPVSLTGIVGWVGEHLKDVPWYVLDAPPNPVNKPLWTPPLHELREMAMWKLAEKGGS